MMDELIKSSRILICAGSGGVGKTTVSASLAVRAAELGLKTLVLTVDPAKRLATTLGLGAQQGEVRVPEQKYKGELYAAVLDSKQIFDEFVQNSATSPELAQKLMTNPLYHQLSTTLSGSQEFTALEKLYVAYASGKYDLIILDTPPTQHALDFFTAPQKIEDLFQDSITKWFLAPASSGGGWLRGLINQGTRQALKGLEILTGAKFIETLIDFFASIRTFQESLRTHSQAVRELLAHKATRFVLVTSFDAAKLHEAQFFLKELTARRYALGAVIINRAFPDWLPTNESDASKPLREFYLQMRSYYQDRIASYEKFQKSLDQKVTVLKIPEFNQDISELNGLQQLYGSFRK